MLKNFDKMLVKKMLSDGHLSICEFEIWRIQEVVPVKAAMRDEGLPEVIARLSGSHLLN